MRTAQQRCNTHDRPQKQRRARVLLNQCLDNHAHAPRLVWVLQRAQSLTVIDMDKARGTTRSSVPIQRSSPLRLQVAQGVHVVQTMGHGQRFQATGRHCIPVNCSCPTPSCSARPHAWPSVVTTVRPGTAPRDVLIPSLNQACEKPAGVRTNNTSKAMHMEIGIVDVTVKAIRVRVDTACDTHAHAHAPIVVFHSILKHVPIRAYAVRIQIHR
ncbi:hypothetical protein L210DRAFT_182023, partial [Boletus edulis BED1]